MTTYIRNNTETVITIDDLGITLPPGELRNTNECCNKIDLAKSNDIINKVALELLIVNDGEKDLSSSEGIRHLTEHIISAVTDISGKQRVHQTSRKLGLRIMWTGVGDDTTNVHTVGNGNTFDIQHDLGESDPEAQYIDFNIVNNETWLHEGYLTWKDCEMDSLTVEIVPRVTNVVSGTNTNYNLYGGYMVVPAAGDGTIDLVDDITDPNNGLIFMPNNDLNEPPTAFWNADYNSTTKLYENITPAPYADGSYNMFSIELVFSRFLNQMPLLGNGFICLNSSDTDRLGHGMRLKMIADTNNNVDDHKWAVACLMCLHREKSV